MLSVVLALTMSGDVNCITCVYLHDTTELVGVSSYDHLMQHNRKLSH
jgi:hypothetical protein